MVNSTHAAQLRLLMLGIEEELGLQTLKNSERDVFYAATSIAPSGASIKSDDIKNHKIVSMMPAPTFYRALKVLVAKGMLKNYPGTKKGSYLLS
jgi:hypothetical protein